MGMPTLADPLDISAIPAMNFFNFFWRESSHNQDQDQDQQVVESSKHQDHYDKLSVKLVRVNGERGHMLSDADDDLCEKKSCVTGGSCVNIAD